MTLARVLGFVVALLAFNAAAIAVLALAKRSEKRAWRQRAGCARAIALALGSSESPPRSRLGETVVVEALTMCSERFVLPLAYKDVAAFLGRPPAGLPALRRRLRSRARERRLEAASRLRFYGRPGANALRSRFPDEPSPAIRLRIAESLVFCEDWDSVPMLVASADGGPGGPDRTYVSRLCAILSNCAGAVARELAGEYPAGKGRRLLALWLAERFPCEAFESVLLRSASGSDELSADAALVLDAVAPRLLDDPRFYGHGSLAVRGYALRALGRSGGGLDRLLAALDDPELAPWAEDGLARAVDRNPAALRSVLEAFTASESEAVRRGLAPLLDAHLDFFMADLRSARRPAILGLLTDLAGRGSVYGIASFLNRNNDPAAEADVAAAVTRGAAGPEALAALSSALRPETRARLGLPEPPARVKPPRPPASRGDRAAYLALFVAVMALPTALFFLMGGMSGATGLGAFTLRFTLAFGWYALALNAVSVALLGSSVLELGRQLRLKHARSSVNAFRGGMLPSVSVIVPAYNEEASIAETVRALLSMRYPAFEVIVVNDGSSDGTLDVLRRAYALERRSGGAASPWEQGLGTETVLGSYRSPANPRLFVIDKANGGKADSLNAGIEAATGDYVCGIDADSILEPEALLRAMSAALDEDDEVLALGGNILPVNGCEVVDGDLARIGLARRPLAVFQTTEYLRAFLAGRLGWSRMKSLLIISGAFGVFKRRRVVESGGYMTRRSRLGRDTVGEDMELVVRLSGEARRARRPFVVRYSFDANCWTEVPEDAGTLYKQRDRWQRGLLEIMSAHRGMIGNPAYGRLGLVAIPYFMLFEIIGPVYELLSWGLFALGIALGTIPLYVFLFTFASSILFGMFVSLASIAVGERQVLYFSPLEDLRLIAYAVAESFGFRQWMSAMRVNAHLRYALGVSGGWGAMKRKGFGKA